MNERIKQLAEQAEEYASQFAYAQTIGHPGYKEEFNEKFAQLLVQECANRLRSEVEFGKAQMTTANAYKLAFMSQAADIIEKHIGVEK